eukprot:362139-Chlamydomonas_euryale.AAC.8
MPTTHARLRSLPSSRVSPTAFTHRPGVWAQAGVCERALESTSSDARPFIPSREVRRHRSCQQKLRR